MLIALFFPIVPTSLDFKCSTKNVDEQGLQYIIVAYSLQIPAGGYLCSYNKHVAPCISKVNMSASSKLPAIGLFSMLSHDPAFVKCNLVIYQVDACMCIVMIILC